MAANSIRLSKVALPEMRVWVWRGVCARVPVCAGWVAPAMRDVASTSMRAERTDRAKEEMNMATEGSQPLCWNKRGI